MSVTQYVKQRCLQKNENKYSEDEADKQSWPIHSSIS